MNPTRIVLIESLDSTGADARDALTRARALAAAGCEVRCAIVNPVRADLLHASRAAMGTLVVRDDPAGRSALLEWLGASATDGVLVASAAGGGGAVGRWIAGDTAPWARWWPTGLGARPPATGTDPGAPSGSVGPLAAFSGAIVKRVAGEPWPGACAGIESGAVTDARPSRGQLPLWDGEYLLAPAPLSGAAGSAALDAFAILCAAHDDLDLVVLADPQPAFERQARRSGIGFRVHFAGPATRDAELAWLGSATAALIAGDAPLSGGLVLRALAHGCPLLASPGAASGPALEAWLGSRALARGASGERLPVRLEQILTPDSAWRERARAVLAGYRVEALAARLAPALAGARRRAA